MKYVASLSFGKDSMAMLIKIKELGLPLDEVIYVDIMFDDDISGETPEMASFITKAEKILKEKYFKETCRCCRFNCENSKDLPDDIGKPIKSKVDYFPSHKGCKDFEWD